MVFHLSAAPAVQARPRREARRANHHPAYRDARAFGRYIGKIKLAA